ncbi:MAG: cation diffusion facilitator family transporter [Acidimicrobiia bacterium]|nr:cation diffusion facilitator family transporter [Acidimicrobiia bacterium]
MSRDHEHVSIRSGERHKRALLISFLLVGVFMVVEVVTGWLTSSLALISDAGHMATDTVGLGLALGAIMVASHGGSHTQSRTFGMYRLEVLAALLNSVLLFGVAVYVVREAFIRLGEPREVIAGPLLVVATLGLIVNIIAFYLLRGGAQESLNIEGAYLEVVADLLGSVGVIVAATIIFFTGWTWVDPVFGAAIGIFILPRAWRLGRRSLRILIQAAPDHFDLDAARRELAAIPGVVDVHDLHVWTLTSEMDVGSVHLMTKVETDPHPVLDRARDLLAERGIDHATLQVEPEDHTTCAEIQW